MELEAALRRIIEGVSGTYGEQFFRRITRLIGEVVEADFAYIARIDDDWTNSRTIAVYAHGEMADNIEYPLNKTPCEQVLGDSVCVYPASVATLFPEDKLLADMQVEAYIGSSLRDSNGKVIGLLVTLYHGIVSDPVLIRTIIELFAGRISSEMERHDLAEALAQANELLEQRVEARTREQTEALNALKQSREQQLEQQQYAALGGLVTGIAQELNTPLAIGVTSSGHIGETLEQLRSELAQQRLTDAMLASALDDLEESAAMLDQNLSRVVKLIRNFEQVAVDSGSGQLATIRLTSLIDAVLTGLSPEISRQGATIEVEIPKELEVISYPGDLTQVLSQLILNSLVHAFPDGDGGRIVITAIGDEGRTTIKVCDDGVGIPQSQQEKVFDPFFTTKRGEGGSGLGLNIVHNIIHRKLAGEITLNSIEGNGCCFTITLPG